MMYDLSTEPPIQCGTQPMNLPLSNCLGSPPLGEIHNNFAYCSDCKEVAEFSDCDEETDPISFRRSFEEWWEYEGKYLPNQDRSTKDIAEYAWSTAIKNVINPHQI